MENKMRVAVYCRVAREDDKAIKKQEIMLRQFAEKNDYKNISIYSDNGFSGLNFNRLVFQRLNEDISAGLIETVIVKNISRISRNYIDMLKWVNNIRSIGVSLKSVSNDLPDTDVDETINPLYQLINDYRIKQKRRNRRTK